jgi:sulfite reductase (NADPH) hemoprotein beta-component
MAGGGLGSQPITAVEVLPFVTEDELSTVVEALARLHQRYSDRKNRNQARIKFVLKRFGAEVFAALFQEEFDRLKGLPQRPWQALEWRTPVEAPVARTPVGLIASPDGSFGVVAYVPLGLVSSEQLDALHDMAVEAGVTELRTTRDQNIAFVGVARDRLTWLVQRLKAIGFEVPASPLDVPDVVSCPGTTTCRIGITNAQSFGRLVEEESRGDASARGVSVHVSGCQNSCGLHHVADIGLHGMAKKIDGRSAPHYQLHLGGNAHTGEIAVEGPLVAARFANDAVRLLRRGYAEGRGEGEGVRVWAERLGKEGVAALLQPIEGGDADGLFVDWGDTAEFPGAPRTKGECAAPFAAGDLLADLADDGLITLDRALAAGRSEAASAAADSAVLNAARRLLATRQLPIDEDDPSAALRGAWSDVPEVLAAYQAARAEGEPEARREAVALFIDTVREAVERPAAAAAGDLSAIMAAVAE